MTATSRGSSRGSRKGLPPTGDLVPPVDCDMPHEWLLRVMRGEPVKQRRLRINIDPQSGVETSREWVEEEWYASFEQRLSAARDAAPFFAPRLAAHAVGAAQADIEQLRDLFSALAAKLPV